MTIMDGKTQRLSIHIASDKGPKQMPSICCLYFKLKMRGCPCWDLLHEDWNGLQPSALEACFWLPIAERELIRSVRHGPYGSHQIFQRVKAQLETTFDIGGPAHELFVELFESLCVYGCGESVL